ncbi:hypothetical protein VOLCADRAFT_106387 [Volvox carteri f. nagariensis]|uniref:Uncharacterized protein n=1 Tax=Volvox carteri f. nagariensis TaxID=3068 RepID=D8U734_VOLCA|nr:uncharacterized protein VOLCADRAFT_106387 [Volvox carteri f. nagariensis]EFJ44408.1 hypothetical protein VOLCADRAFT_106387 [Volvox carteri f. nagariensis]|eukprot:XP_002954515.1 hypothetical protein VOLCADRAFT_106387 [Volvox carteri f. nagariensis]
MFVKTARRSFIISSVKAYVGAYVGAVDVRGPDKVGTSDELQWGASVQNPHGSVIAYMGPAVERVGVQSLAPGQDHSARLVQIAQVVMSRVGAKMWRSYESLFASFVRFCVVEGLEFLPASHYAGLLWVQFLAAKGTVQARTAQPHFSAVNTVHDLLGFPSRRRQCLVGCIPQRSGAFAGFCRPVFFFVFGF